MTKGSEGNKFKNYRLIQKVFLLNSVIRDDTISDYGILVYCYLRAIQRADINWHYISINAMDYYFRQTYEVETRDKKKYVDGLNDLEQHGLIKKISGKKFDFEYDLQPIYFDPTKTNKENGMWFSVVYSNELSSIMQIDEIIPTKPDEKLTISKAKLIRYYVNVVSTFMNGREWSYKLEDGTRTDGVVGFSSIEALANMANISKDTVTEYNKLLEKAKILYVFRAKELYLIDGDISGITNTYGRYKYKDFVLHKGQEHKAEYGYRTFKENVKHKTKKTQERKSMGAKYYNLVERGKKYDQQTIIDIYIYAFNYNEVHGDDDYYADKLKDLDFFKQFPFITEDCLKEKKKKPKHKKSDEFIWGEPDPMETDYSVEEILDMPTTSSIYEELDIDNKDDFY